MTAQDYLNLPYNIIVRHISDESGDYYFATVLEMPGCMSDGKTSAEAFENIREAMEGWIETKLENGYAVPRPLPADTASGRFVVRVPKTLHARLTIEAAKEGVSLNQWALYKLSAQA
jgi:predicted RNase H-like HicB family nuclease